MNWHFLRKIRVITALNKTIGPQPRGSGLGARALRVVIAPVDMAFNGLFHRFKVSRSPSRRLLKRAYRVNSNENWTQVACKPSYAKYSYASCGRISLIDSLDWLKFSFHTHTGQDTAHINYWHDISRCETVMSYYRRYGYDKFLNQWKEKKTYPMSISAVSAFTKNEVDKKNQDNLPLIKSALEADSCGGWFLERTWRSFKITHVFLC